MNQFKFLVALFIVITFVGDLYSQCSDIYFYRVNSVLQSDKTVYLIQNGKTIAQVRLGDRYKATVCSPGEYEFTVKMNPNNLTLASKTIEISGGQNYYLNIVAPVGVEVATISNVKPLKGEKTVTKGSKFTSEVKTIQIVESQKSISSTTMQTPNNSTSNNGTFQRSQTVNNFQFDIVDIKRMGDDIQFEYKITNLAGTDKVLGLTGYSFIFYDNIGNFYTPTDYCLLKACQRIRAFDQPRNFALKGKFEHRVVASGLIPRGIPVNAMVRFSNVDKNANQFSRGEIILNSKERDNSNPMDFKLSYVNIPFPSDIDPSNPNKRIIGSQTIELLKATKKGNDVLFHFEVANNSSDIYELGIKNGVSWDNTGNENQIHGFSFGNQNQIIDLKNSYNESTRKISGSSKLEVYLQSRNISNSATQMRRLTVQFKDFELSWEDINIESSSITSISQISSTKNYITYQEFESRINKKENVVGKKIVLENIYFTTGNDDLLSTSHSQLDKLANLMTTNGEVNVEISGHTDNVGDNISNMLLSQKRADVVKYYLIGKSISPNRISSIGKGENEPIENNATEIGKQKNRRVEITIKE